jgi:hypothetical protein
MIEALLLLVSFLKSGHKTRSVFDQYNIVDERDLRGAIPKIESHSGRSLGTI